MSNREEFAKRDTGLSTQASASRTTQEQTLHERLDVVGTRQTRLDASLKASGAAIFGTDVRLPGLLHGKILRSTYPHARIVKLEVGKAERFPGVRAVVTANDFPDVKYGFVLKDLRVLARNVVVYHGQPICAVAADTLEIAERALGEIEVEYEPLPTVLTTEDSLKDDSEPVHPDVTPLGSPPYKSRNVASYTRVHRGNVERAFKVAD